MEEYSLIGLFVSAFVSSTLLPGGSELLLLYLAAEGQYSSWLLLIVASTGNTLGGMTSWLLGLWIASRYPAQDLVQKNRVRALAWIQHWGSPILLLSWLPIVGDPLCLVAGWLRMHWLPSMLMIMTGKALRYAALLWLIS